MDGLSNVLNWQIAHAGPEVATALHRLCVGFRERFAIGFIHPIVLIIGRPAVVDVSAVDVEIRLIAIVEPEIRTGREDAGENESGTVSPKRVVIIMGYTR
jgi:hypothetical protein